MEGLIPGKDMQILEMCWTNQCNGRFDDSGTFRNCSWYKNLVFWTTPTWIPDKKKKKNWSSLLTAYKLEWIMKNSSASPKVDQRQMIKVQDIA